MSIYPRLKVFVSSKMAELAPERQAIKVALDTLKVDGWVFEEDAGARPTSIQETFLQEVEDADLYVGLFWKGFGEYTIEEYEHAKNLGKDCLIYEKRSEIDGSRDPKLQSFLDEIGHVETGQTIQWFDTPEKLGESVQADIAHWQTSKIRERQAPIKTSQTVAEKKQRDELLLLLSRVKEFWIKGVLEQSIHSEALIELNREEWTGKPTNQSHPWESIIQLPDQTSLPLDPDKPIAHIFEEVGRSLLILGAPGSGKTTTLLELTRDLANRAELDASLPVPVVFNLSSWAENRLPLTEWLVNELNSKYLISKKLCRNWIDDRWIVPMFDGLDEVNEEYRSECVDAINAFINDVGVPGLVVCSRLHEYEEMPEKVRTGGAVCLEQLTSLQVSEYIKGVGPQLHSLEVALQQDNVLQTLAETPLMLNVMCIAYSSADQDQVVNRENVSVEDRRKEIFATYTDRMFSRKGTHTPPFSKNQVVKNIAWLATKMKSNSQSVFAVEGLQINWLSDRYERLQYRLFVVCCFFVVAFAIGSGFIGRIDLTLLFYVLIGCIPLIVRFERPLIVGLIGGYLGCVIYVIVDTIFLPNSDTSIVYFMLSFAITLPFLINFTTPIKYYATFVFIIMIIQFLLEMATKPAYEVELLLLGHFLILSILFLFLSICIALINWIGIAVIDSKTETVESLSFDIKLLQHRFIYFLPIFAFIVVPFSSLQEFGLITFFSTTALLVLVMTLTIQNVSIKNYPNQGITKSFQNAVIIFGLSGCLTLMAYLIWYPYAFSFIEAGLMLAISVGLLLGLLFGGMAVLKHYALRLVFLINGIMPLKSIQLLDYSSRLILLKKVGGSYIFIHRMLLEYFADLDSDNSEKSNDFNSPPEFEVSDTVS